MASITVTVGASSSGKSTYAANEIKKFRGQIVEVNRDNTRKALFGITGWNDYKFNKSNEGLVTIVNKAAIQAALSTGKSVIISDTNLNPVYRNDFRLMAGAAGVEYKEIWFPVELDELKSRNEKRGKWRVDDRILVDMYNRFTEQYKPGEHIEYIHDYVAEKTAKYVPDTSLQNAVIFDIDGTLAHMGNHRHPYEWDKVGMDAPKHNVIQHAFELSSRGVKIVVTSGRDAVCRAQTEDWLKKWGVKFDVLLMRAEGDQRGDDIVKEEIFWRDIAPNYNVMYAVDDRNRVVDKWRSLGIECWQVAPGDF